MSKQTWPIEIDCDAPAYAVVQASRQAGIRTPEDVRWVRLCNFVRGRVPPPGHPGGACSCGEPLPKAFNVSFAFPSGGTLGLLLGQCPRCHTVFWEQP